LGARDVSMVIGAADHISWGKTWGKGARGEGGADSVRNDRIG